MVASICFAGIMIIYESTQFDATSIDLTWNIEPIVTWATVELNMVVVSSESHTSTDLPLRMFLSTSIASSKSRGTIVISLQRNSQS